MSPHLWFSRVFYEAARDLDSQPSPRADHVEACRPRECFLQVQCSAAPMRRSVGGALRRATQTQNDAVPGRLRNPLGPARKPFSVGGAASHLSGLALYGLVPRLN